MDSGSCFVQISDENVHRVRCLMDEVFGAGNFVNLISFATSTGSTTKALPRTTDYILWYARHLSSLKFRQLYGDQEEAFDPSGSDERGEYELASMTSQHPSETRGGPLVFRGQEYSPSEERQWSFDPANFGRLVVADRVVKVSEKQIRWKKYKDERARGALGNRWNDTQFAGFSSDKVYAVQTSTKVIQRCLLMTTDPGDLVFDPTCGSGTTAYVAEQWGRRWITCDTSRVAITIARQRLMTAVFDYYELAHPQEDVGSGFKYKTVPHVTLKSIANNPDIDGIHARWTEKIYEFLVSSFEFLEKERIRRHLEKAEFGLLENYINEAAAADPELKTKNSKLKTLLADRRAAIDAAIARHADQETLYDQPFVDRKKVRVTGPFTVEAVPAPAVKSVDEILEPKPEPPDASIARSGETLRQAEWRDELLRTGIRGKNGQYIRFARLEPLPGCRWLHAEGETRPSDEGANTVRESAPAYDPMRVVVSFGPEHGPLEQRQVEHAWQEARMLVPKPKLLIFAAFQFDPEAAKDIDEMKPELAGMQFLKVQMNADLLTEDLKKKRASNESFWLIGQPDVEVRKTEDGRFVVEVHGFDYYNTKTGQIESGGKDKIAVWMLDTDYDGRSLYPRQVFFPMAGENEGWAKLAKNLKAEIDEERMEAYRGTVSLPFEAGEHKRLAVKIVDDRGIESLKVVRLK